MSGMKKHWIATAILESHRPFSNELRLEELAMIIGSTLSRCPGPGLFVFPAGHFCTGKDAPRTIYPWLEEKLTALIEKSGTTFALCFGIDGRQKIANDQIACAVTSNGIEAKGRKFFPTKDEKYITELADGHQSLEDGLPRIFNFLGSRYYLAICYDSCGISNSSFANPGCDAILNFVHGFQPRGQGPSGDVQFARKVFSGASKRWGIPLYGSAVFFNRHIPDNWPSGVLWNKGADLSVSRWLYEYNPLRPAQQFPVLIPEGRASVRVFGHA